MNLRVLAIVSFLLACVAALPAAIVYVPNGSFEAPDTPFADPRIDAWQDNPKPDWYNETNSGPWDQLTGVFENPDPSSPSYIDNMHGTQAAFLFAVPQAGMFQDYNSIDWAHPTPTHEFNARFQVGKSYRLTVGVIGGGGGMLDGASLGISLYYRDGSNMVTVAMSNVVHSSILFSNNTHFIDIPLRVPTVRSNHAWAGQNIGIALNSTIINPLLAGGYWDVDNVRLVETIEVPNGSFESPDTPFADQRIDSWQDNPKPDWYDEAMNGPWDQLTGVFENTDTSNPSHIHNMDGTQAAFLFNVPQAGFFQDYDSTDWAHPIPTHDFNARFESGKSYRLTVGVIGGGGGMREGASLGIALYYRASSNMVFVAMTNVAHSLAVFSTTTNFVDIPLTMPAVKPTDAWADQNIGIAIFSTVTPDLIGGYWDLDNVRLAEITPVRLSIRRGGEITVHSDPGLKFEILASSDLSAPVASWPVIGTVTNTSGTASFADPSPSATQRFYVARQVP